MAKLSAKKAAAKLKEQVSAYIANPTASTFNYKQVSHAIGADTPAAQRSVALLLAELAFDGDIVKSPPANSRPRNATMWQPALSCAGQTGKTA